MGTESQAITMTIEINTPAGRPPERLFLDVARHVYGRLLVIACAGEQPPQLKPSITALQIARDLDDVAKVKTELCNVAIAAICSLVRVWAADDTPPTS